MWAALSIAFVKVLRYRTLRLWAVLGACLSAVCLMFLAPLASTAATGGNWTQYGHDPQRSSVDPDQPPVTGVSLDWSGAVDGSVFAQPLVFNGRVYVATENNSVYAFDATTGAPIWHQSPATLGQPATEADVTLAGKVCSNLGPTVGITSTPVIDPVTNRLYAVAQVRSPALHYVLWTLDLNNGGAPIGAGATIDPWFLEGRRPHPESRDRSATTRRVAAGQ